MGNPVVHFEIVGKDGKKLQNFYAKLFDWEIDANNPMDYGLVKPQTEGGLGGGISANEPGKPAYVTIYMGCDNLESKLEQVVKLGGKVETPPMTIPGMVTFATFRDPDDNLIGLVLNTRPE